jgi:hypothetical protein
MPKDLYDAWNASLEEVKQKVTGVGVWTALNVAIPITVDDGVFVLGFRPQDRDLMGHLKRPGTQRVIEDEILRHLGEKVKVYLLDGITINDWNTHKRLQAEAKKVKERDSKKAVTENLAARKWDDFYDQLSRDYTNMPTKSMPQARARFLDQAVGALAAQLEGTEMDEAAERNFARCLERVGQYAECPPSIVATMVLQRLGEL